MKKITFLLFLCGCWFYGFSQCINTSKWPTNDVTANNSGNVANTTACAYFGDYSVLVGLNVNDGYEFSVSSGGFITLVSNADGTTVLSSGSTPIQWTATSTSVQIHVNIDSSCGTDTSCHTISYQNLTPPPPPDPPANDECVDAIVLTVNSDDNCTSTASGTVLGATDSGVTGSGCFGTADDDVWFSFEATATSHDIALLNISGGTADLYHALYDGASGCTSLGTAIKCSDPNSSTTDNLVIGNTYYLQVYSYTSSAGQTTAFDVCVSTTPPPPDPPANDDCGNAIALTVNPDVSCSNSTSGTVAGATDSGVSGSGCFGTDDDDVWFSFVATNTEHTINLLNITGNTTDMYHAIYDGVSGCATLGAALKCSDPNASVTSGLTIGNTYLVQVYSYTSTPDRDTTFDICVGTLPPPPINDLCGSAIALTIGTQFTDNAVGGQTNASASASGELPAPSCASYSPSGTAGGDLWYSVVVPADGRITIETQADPSGNGGDSGMQIYSGSCGSLVAVECDDDDSSDGAYSLVSVDDISLAGQTIYIRVWEFGGNNIINFQVSAYVSPLNDMCADATPVNLDEDIVGDNTAATYIAITNDCFNGTKSDVWYSFTAPSTGEIFASITSGFQYGFYSDCSGSQVGECNTSPVTGLTPGVTYYFRVNDDGTSRAPGVFTARLSGMALSTTDFDVGLRLSFYPNPTASMLYINANENIDHLKVFNLLGQQVMQMSPKTSEVTLDMSQLSDGNYFVRLESDDRTDTIKVIKK
ncbi:T9SS type A sorting domain-containing protein [Winogradskyella maritima]|uniref:T9SS type A sorting domain-containing protein n=1 Tax=Winogradskyella maritima TaxID=1517766 RepID=A0ABV8AGR0_9FLAO|nr:T9SS type A sorting domain-containing protein [Winogradskyella maritima]